MTPPATAPAFGEEDDDDDPEADDGVGVGVGAGVGSGLHISHSVILTSTEFIVMLVNLKYRTLAISQKCGLGANFD